MLFVMFVSVGVLRRGPDVSTRCTLLVESPAARTRWAVLGFMVVAFSRARGMPCWIAR